jgi:hypothetical protein
MTGMTEGVPVIVTLGLLLAGSTIPVAPTTHAGRGIRVRCLHHAVLMAVMTIGMAAMLTAMA